MIPSSSGVKLEVEVAGPGSPSAPLLILSHPHPKMGGEMHHKIIETLFQRSLRRGWGVARFNFRGVGASTGTYDSGVGETEDLLAVLRHVSNEFSRPNGSISVIGYSFGSWVAAKAAASLSELAHLVLIAPPLKVMDFSALRGVKHPKHVFAAGRDDVTPSGLLKSWYSELSSPKSIRLFENADHGFSGTTGKLVDEVLVTVSS